MRVRAVLLAALLATPASAQVYTGPAVTSVNGASGAIISTQMSYSSTATKTVVNTTSETSVIGTGVGTLIIPANACYAGKAYRLTVYGQFSTLLTPGNITPKIKLGSVVGATSTITNLLTSASNASWEGQAIIIFLTCGSSGTVNVGGSVGYDTGTLVQGSAALVGQGIVVNTTSTIAVDATVTWATASASNSIGTYIATLEALN